MVTILSRLHHDVIKWKHFPRYWPFVRGIHRLPVNSHHKGQWHQWGLWFETPSCSLRRHCDGNVLNAGENVRWLSSWWRLLINAYQLPFNVFASSFGYNLSYNIVIYLAFVFLHYLSRELFLCFPDFLCLIYVSHFRPGQYWILSIISVTCSILRDGKGR